MPEPLFVAIDLGTTACKAAIFSPTGQVLSMSYREYPLLTLSAKLIEQDANEWWMLVADCIVDCANQIHDSQRKNIRALGISAQGITFVPVNKSGVPISNAITWLDSRAELEAEELVNTFGMEAIYQKTGLQATPLYILPKIMWMKKNDPDVFFDTDRFCTSQDFLISKLTGRYITDYSIAGGSLLLDLHKPEWCEDLLNVVPLGREKLPALDWAGSVVGPLKREIADLWGFPQDTLVVLGGHDQECSGIGAGLQPGEMTISFGTASILLACIDKPLLDPLMRIPCLPSVETNKWVLEAVVSVGGAGLRWMRDFINGFSGILNRGDSSFLPLDYDQLTKICQNVEIGSLGVTFYPHMTGATSPYWISSATGVFHGISLSTSLPHMIRAVIEGWIFQIKNNFQVVKEITYDPKQAIIFGGGAKSRFIQQLSADILNKPIFIPETTESSLLGACILASVGSGIHKDIPSAQKAMIRRTECVEPVPDNVQMYQAFYEKYWKTEQKILYAG
jgi:sugar (pentulose or hexulose) kinase